MQPDLMKESSLFRTSVSKGIAPVAEIASVDRTGGQYKAGLIRRISVLTVGEALGHQSWIDQEMLEQVSLAINTKPEGVKARFAHPSVSGDGIGKMTGRVMNASVEGNRVLADWHALESAHRTPDGDLAGYVMDLAEEAPADFGTSIAFQRDMGSEKKFQANNAGTDGRFVSPDETNKNNFPHVRLAALKAVDIVDEPAANPGGLFHRNPFDLLESGDAALAYAFGLSEEAPDTSPLGIDATRLRGFVNRFCQSRGLTFSKESAMADEVKPTEEKPVETAPVKTPEQFAAAGQKAERDRVSNIMALCKIGKRMDLAEGFIEAGKTVPEVQSALLSATPNDTGAGNLEPEAVKPNTENAKYVAEFKADPRYAKSMTEAEYVAMRRVDDGLDVLQIGPSK